MFAQNLESLLAEAKEEYKNLDKQLENAAIKCSTYREQNKVHQLNVDNLEQAMEVKFDFHIVFFSLI